MSDAEPTAAPVRDGLFTAAEDGSPRLVGGRCDSCGRHHFPRLSTCPYCSVDEVREALLSPKGSLWGWTAVTSAPPGYRGDVPFGFGVVELPEGVRVVTRLTETSPSRLEFGQPMELVITPLHVDDTGQVVVTYAFSPTARRP